MAVEIDTVPRRFADYAHPERLVSTGWLAEHLGDPGWWWSSPTRTCCSTRPATSPAP